MWVSFGVPGGIAFKWLYALYSDNYGADWTALLFYTNSFGYGYKLGHPRSNGDNVWIPAATGPGGSRAGVYYTSNKGGAWALADLAASNTIYHVCLNPLLPNLAYVAYNALAGRDLRSVTNLGAQTALQDDLGPLGYDVMWFDSVDENHQRILRDGKQYATDDQWATESDGGAVSLTPLSFSPAGNSDLAGSIVGLTLGTHVIGTLDNEADTTSTGIAGTNAGGAPYADSIPNTCGGLAQMGIQAIPITGFVHVYDVIFEDPTPDDGSVHVGSVVFEDPTPDDGSVHVGSVAFEEG